LKLSDLTIYFLWFLLYWYCF